MSAHRAFPLSDDTDLDEVLLPDKPINTLKKSLQVEFQALFGKNSKTVVAFVNSLLTSGALPQSVRLRG